MVGAVILLGIGLLVTASGALAILIARRQRRDPEFPRSLPLPAVFSWYWMPWWFNMAGGIVVATLGLIAFAAGIAQATTGV